MAYNKTVWVDGPTGGTPVNAANLNNIEDGIVEVETQLGVGGQWITKGFANNGESVVAFDNIFVDTTGGAFNLVLPATPNVSDRVKFVDVSGNFGTDNFTINVAAGDKFMGVVDDFLLLTTNNDFVELTFSTESGWVITGKP